MNSKTAAEPRQHNKVRGRPFPKGVSGNPGGRLSVNERHRERFTELEAELGGDLTAHERVLLDQAVGLSLRKAQDHADAVKLANASARILSTLYAKRAQAKPVQPSGPSLSEVLSRMERRA